MDVYVVVVSCKVHLFFYFALLSKSGKWLVLANCNVPCLDYRIAERRKTNQIRRRKRRLSGFIFQPEQKKLQKYDAF